MNGFRILEGYGDYSNPSECWEVQFLTAPDGSDLVFADHDEAVEFSANYYDTDLFERTEWKSYWNYATDADSIEEAMNEWDMKA
jgi:hypothetical protein